jgi:hypothetical protein
MIISSIVIIGVCGDPQMKGTVACLVKVVWTGARQIRKLGHAELHRLPGSPPLTAGLPTDHMVVLRCSLAVDTHVGNTSYTSSSCIDLPENGNVLGLACSVLCWSLHLNCTLVLLLACVLRFVFEFVSNFPFVQPYFSAII